jgi:hypothetical protein
VFQKTVVHALQQNQINQVNRKNAQHDRENLRVPINRPSNSTSQTFIETPSPPKDNRHEYFAASFRYNAARLRSPEMAEPVQRRRRHHQRGRQGSAVLLSAVAEVNAADAPVRNIEARRAGLERRSVKREECPPIRRKQSAKWRGAFVN